ncbi:MAG: YgjP-like metallopeptidase domain-containing protein [Peptoniphilus harei]|nr:YgjP-like metallopeptidase domain-containing protein [Peptoniphilus harei]MDU5467804.1 YgjP-like metallopeptidase domain-containing protein [Peptoniphilus harei]
MEIEINRKKVKKLRIKVEDGIIKVSAPLRTSEREIKKLVENNKELIEELKLADESRKRYKNHLFGKKIDFTSDKDLEKIYRSELKKALDEIFEKYGKLTGLFPKSVEIRKMKVRWGTCYPKSGAIKINLYLAERPREEIEAVVLHELVHLKYIYHDKKFKDECKKYMPNYEEIERDLKR